MCRDRRLDPFRPLVLAFGLFVLVIAVSAAVLFVKKMGGTPANLRNFYLGSANELARPKTLAGLLEVALPHLLAIPLVLFTTLHLVGWVGMVRPRPFQFLTRAAFGCAFAAVAAGFGVRYFHPVWAVVKIAAFLGLESVLLLWLLLLATAFARSSRQSNDDNATTRLQRMGVGNGGTTVPTSNLKR